MGVPSIDDLIRRVEDIQQVLLNNSLIQDIIRRNEGLIVDLNTEEQLQNHGVNSLGVSINSYAPYSPKTVYLKQKKGQPWNRVTLRDTGHFHGTFQIGFLPDGFQISSADSLTPTLTSKYGDEIFGLTEESKEYLKKSITLPELLEELNKRLL